jgi:hypothetical protein
MAKGKTRHGRDGPGRPGPLRALRTPESAVAGPEETSPGPVVSSIAGFS